jgi:DMSO/TMAO reductase YedYZ molybdopterin-dependent catalytic subunit
MVLSILHWVPSAIAAVCTILLAVVKQRNHHRTLSYGMVFFASIGLLDYISQGNFTLFILDLHVIHSWIGLSALLLSVFNFVSRISLGGKRYHCLTGYAGAALSLLALSLGVILLLGSGTSLSIPQTEQVSAANILPEVEANEFRGVLLTQLSAQRNNAIQGTQIIDRESYRLHVTGLVESELNVTYKQLLSLPAYSQVVYMPCVEGWGFYAKWTGFRIADLLELAKLRTNAAYVVFHSSDGYSTGLPLDYLISRTVLMAYGINDVTLPPDRGFPFQVVAVDKYGYKWAKWVTEVEVVDKVVAGFWESRGYSNSADVGGFPYGG